jgi:energy-coupling factor transporter transmembrane protein EcfT
LIQQLTYPVYWFAGRTEMESTGKLEIRMGMYKFYMMGIHIVILCTLYYWDKAVKKFNPVTFLLFLLLAVGVYVFLARKMVFALLFCMLITFFLSKKIKWYFWVIALLFFFILYAYADILLNDYIEKTSEELSNPDFIRFQSLLYFLYDFKDSLCLLLGNGQEHKASAYGEYMVYLQDNFHFYKEDIGIVAYFNRHGIVGMIPVLLFVIFLVRKRKYIPLYIKLYFVFWGIQLIFAFPLNTVYGKIALINVLYLMELNIQKNKCS